jgi:NADH:ubiquinone oxidoreductase subunit E
MADAEKIRVVVCMGSSCFSRGNSLMLKILQDYIRENGLENRVEIRGSLCEDSCKCGPNITINGMRYSAPSETACLKLLAGHLQGSGCSEEEPLPKYAV